MSSSSSSPAPEAGLGHSTPLVTIPHMHGSGIQIRTAQAQQQRSTSTSTSTPTTDHPLATVTPPPPRSVPSSAIASGMDVELSDRSSSSSSARNHQHAAGTASNTNANTQAPASASIPSAPHTGIGMIPAPVSTPAPPLKPKTLEEMTDIFLTGPQPSSGMDTANTNTNTKIMLRPQPLPNVPDLERLRVLVERRAWADVLQVTALLLKSSVTSPYVPLYTALLHNPSSQLVASLDSHQADLVEILSLQCHAWIKLKKYMELGLEVDRWSFSHHTGGTTPPTWIPWSLHILAASSLQYTTATSTVTLNSTGSSESTHAAENTTKDAGLADAGLVTAADALCAIRADLPVHLYQERLQVEQALANIFVRQKEWRLALQSLQRMMDLIQPVCVKELKKNIKKDDDDVAAVVLESAYRCDLLSRQGHILLQVGAVEQAWEIFQQCKSLWSGLVQDKGLTSQDQLRQWLPNHYEAVQLIPAQLDANEGLFSFACGKYDQACEFFRSTIQEIRMAGASSTTNTGMAHTYRRKDWVGSGILRGTEFRHCLYSETMNNMALCAIYTCRLHEAVHTMECLVREDPTAFLTERVAYNLCTLYELGSDTTASARQKRVLQIVAKRFYLHDIGSECFRIS